MKKTILLIISLVCISTMMLANSLSGKVIDQNSKVAIPYVTVSLLSTDSILLTGTITDEKGLFTIDVQKNASILCLSYMGYKTLYYNAPKITSGQEFVMVEEVEHLDEVEIKGSTPLVERKMDKIVVNVANSPFAIGNNGKDLLKKAPGVNVDKDGKVTVNGKSVAVYIDGRPSYLDGEQLKAMLESTDGSTIDKIEIITQPSAKYDAAGQGGIINIKTKHNLTKGLNGTLSAGYGGMYWRDIRSYDQNERLSLNLNYRAKKTYTSIVLSQGLWQGTWDDTEQVLTPESERKSNSLSEYFSQHYTVKVSNDWYIDSVNTLGFIVNIPFYSRKKTADAANNISETYQNGILVERNTEGGLSRNKWLQHTINLNYTHVFNDSLDQELTVNLDYNRNNSSNNSTSESLFEHVGQANYFQLINEVLHQPTNRYVAKLDFQTQFWKTGIIECGAKWLTTSTDYAYKLDSTLNNIPGGSYSSDFTYREHVAALYATVGKRFGEHWNTKLGLRGEYTYSHGDWLSADSTTAQSYFNLFPTVFIGYNPTEDWSMSVNYTRRIDRPWYGALNPATRYSDAHSYTIGNPNLKPAFSDNVEVSFGYSQYVTLNFDFSHTKDLFDYRASVLENGDIVNQAQNCGTTTSHGIYLSLTEIPLVPKFSDKDENGKRKVKGAWLALTGYLGTSYDIYRYDDGMTQKTWRYNAYGELNAYLPKDWTLSVDGYYDSPSIWGYSRWTGEGAMNLAIKKDIPKVGLTFTARVDDILLSTHYKNETLGLTEGYKNVSISNGRSHEVSIGLTYKFGTYQEHKWRKVGDSDDSRSGEGGGRGK